MSNFLLLQTGDYLLLETGDKLLLTGDHFETTLPLIVTDLFGYLTPFEGLSTTLPRITSNLSGSLGPTAGINTTLPLIVSILGGVNTHATTLPRITDALFGFVDVQVGSGLYQMQEDDTHDTYYNRIYNGTTINAEIPEPSIQTYLAHDEEENIIHISAVRVRATGSGTLKSTLYTLDLVRSSPLADIVLALTNNKEQATLSNFNSQRIMLKLFTQTIDEYFEINKIILFIKPLWTQKPQ